MDVNVKTEHMDGHVKTEHVDMGVKTEHMDVEPGGGPDPVPAAGMSGRRQPPPPLQLVPDVPLPELPLSAHRGPLTAPATGKRHKPIPPPLDLRMPASPLLCPPRTAIPVISPSSPYHQKNLPFRKR